MAIFNSFLYVYQRVYVALFCYMFPGHETWLRIVENERQDDF